MPLVWERAHGRARACVRDAWAGEAREGLLCALLGCIMLSGAKMVEKLRVDKER